MTESQLQASIVETAQLLGWLVYHTRDSRGSHPGFPDLVLVRAPTAVRAGRLLFVELKSAAGTLELEQLLWLATLRAVAGAHALVCGGQPALEVFEWRPADWDAGAVEAELRA